MSEFTADKLAAAYINIRGEISAKEQEIKALKAKQEVISEKMLAMCKEHNVDSFNTPAGTISRRVHHSYFTTDWDAMYKFVQDHDAFHLLQKRLHDGNMREFLDENPEETPIGLQSNTKYVISVRKPTKKA